MIKAVIFDLDGTLIDAYQAIEKSLNFTLRSLGYKKVSYDQARYSQRFGHIQETSPGGFTAIFNTKTAYPEGFVRIAATGN
jgi:phosphoglycolate phosphatase-like HAD superfamily hydrolase